MSTKWNSTSIKDRPIEFIYIGDGKYIQYKNIVSNGEMFNVEYRHISASEHDEIMYERSIAKQTMEEVVDSEDNVRFQAETMLSNCELLIRQEELTERLNAIDEVVALLLVNSLGGMDNV